MNTDVSNVVKPSILSHIDIIAMHLTKNLLVLDVFGRTRVYYK